VEPAWSGKWPGRNQPRHLVEKFMNPEFAIDLLKSMITLALTIAAPILLTAMIIGLAVSLFQAVTTIHEQTLAFVPKALAVIGIMLLLLPWIVRTLMEFTTAVIMKMPEMVQ
jgi:flagellar biosynthetic protein FliQ